jgi:hypothetical protein
MAQWARQAQGGKASAETAARRLAWLRPSLRWLQQFEPQTEVPDDSTFWPIPGRVAPHIYRPEEIEALLLAARQLGPGDGLRAGCAGAGRLATGRCIGCSGNSASSSAG